MTQPLQQQAIVDGRYRIVDRVGSGGMAEVWCAEDLQLGRRVALKVLYPRFARDAEFVERFRREASSAAGLNHQHVVGVYDRGEWDGTYYIAMEYLEGRTLKQVVTDEAPLAPGRAIEITEQVLRAARFAHRRGIVHRDLKPHNVILDGEGRAKVTDFGIARAGASDMTQTGSIMGTAQYLSPEQAQGLSVGAASDLYSVGILLYELLTGRVPFEGESAVTIALKHVNEAPPAPSALNPAVSPALDAVVQRALEKEPAHRFADADAFLAALAAARSGALDALPATTALAPPAPPPTGPPIAHEAYAYPPEPLPGRPPRDSRRTLLWIIGLLVAAGAIAAAVLLLGGGGSQKTVPDVRGFTLAAATTALESEGFVVDSSERPSVKPKRTVVSQRPSADAKADEGSTVNLTISSGPQQVKIAEVVGLTQRSATNRLEKQGLKVTATSEASDSVEKGRVISASPQQGTTVDTGDSVQLTVSSGRDQVKVPGVEGRDIAAAIATLQRAGLQAEQSEQESDKKPGTVLAQNPAAGATVDDGSTVKLTVAKQPTTVAVPDVTGESAADAVQILAKAGLVPAQSTQDVDQADGDGVVLSQSPSAGDSVDRGSTVGIVVGRFVAAPGAGVDPAAPGGTG